MTIIDSFIFNNELDLLLYRLTVLDEIVDYVILVESTHTFSGLLKPCYYLENISKFDKFKHKIIHIIVEDMPFKSKVSNGEQWHNETHQRNSIAKGIKVLNLLPDDIIITSDLDEIINPSVIIDIINKKSNFKKDELNRCQMDLYYYNLNTKVNSEWHGVKIMTYQTYLKNSLSFEQMRNYEHSHHVNIIPNGGWHLSYFGDENFIFDKLIGFSHQELLNETVLNKNNILTHIHNGTDLFNRKDKYTLIPIAHNKNLPPLYDTLLSKYIRF